MVDFAQRDGVLFAEGHGHDEDEARTALAGALASDRRVTVAEKHADEAQLAEAWFSEEHGFGHDCAAHQGVDKSLWAPGCHAGGFRAVTIAAGIPAAAVSKLQRAPKVDAVPAEAEAVEPITIRGGG